MMIIEIADHRAPALVEALQARANLLRDGAQQGANFMDELHRAEGVIAGILYIDVQLETAS